LDRVKETAGPTRLIRLVANLGYGSQKDVRLMIRDGRLTTPDGQPYDADAKVRHADVRLDGEPLDPPQGVVLMLNKPAGYTCSTKDPGRLVYQLLPDRFARRSPIIATVGRLDRDTTGLLLLTDDGDFLHRVISPRNKVPKIYEATLARPLKGDEAALFAAGTLVLNSESEPLAPALLEPTGERSARITVTEGRYHQVRRMFAAVGNHVEALHRPQIGGLTLGDLPSGQWRLLDAEEIARLFT
jgi:16S rRNA pseudouridine516 synthase